MIPVTKLRAGTYFEFRDRPYRVRDYRHTHMSRGGGTVRVKARDLLVGGIKTMSFQSTEKVEEAQINKKPMQYLYQEEGVLVFMDPGDFSQVEVDEKVLFLEKVYLKAGESYGLLMWGDGEKVLGVELPTKIELEIREAASGEKGNSASNVYKDAVAENGLKLRVPLFVNVGDKVKVDTRTGDYVERV